MTIQQRQYLLAYLGYYNGTADGDWGKLSIGACRAFQKAFGGIAVDGYGGPETDRALKQAVAFSIPEQEEPDGKTDSFWEEIEFFDRREPGIACPCGRCGGFPVEPVERLMRNADAARRHFGRPAIPSSTVRCAAHNAELPGSAANSLHMRGKAMDFAVPGVSAEQLLAYVKTLPKVHEAYAIDGSFVHMGVEKY